MTASSYSCGSERPRSGLSRQAWRVCGPPLRRRMYANLRPRPAAHASVDYTQACHIRASCHLSVIRTLSMLERFYWWIGMNICTRSWWLCRCLQCHARKSSRQTVRKAHPFALSSPSGSPSPFTPRGITYIILFHGCIRPTRRHVRHICCEFTAAVTADILVNT